MIRDLNLGKWKWNSLSVLLCLLLPGLLYGEDQKEKVVVMEKDMRQVKILLHCRRMSQDAYGRVSVWVTQMRDAPFKLAIHYLTKTPEDDYPVSQASRVLPEDSEKLPKITLTDIGDGEYLVMIVINRRRKGSPCYFQLSVAEDNIESNLELLRK